MPKDTKERLLDASLELFARDGYAGTNIKDISQAVGIVKSAFYRHFSSKEDIWNALLDRVEDYYGQRFGSSENLPPIPQNISELNDMILRMVDFTIHDRDIILTRRILLTEQFRDERIRELASRHFLFETATIFTKIFSAMMENGSMKKDDPEMLAFAFSSPISALIQQCDRYPENEPEIMEKISSFTRQFLVRYEVQSIEK